LEDDNLIFWQPYRLNEVERALVHTQITKLLDVSLVELSRDDYASTTVMLAKKDIFWQLDKTLHVWGLSPND
jgi:hypothetical protein